MVSRDGARLVCLSKYLKDSKMRSDSLSFDPALHLETFLTKPGGPCGTAILLGSWVESGARNIPKDAMLVLSQIIVRELDLKMIIHVPCRR